MSSWARHPDALDTIASRCYPAVDVRGTAEVGLGVDVFVALAVDFGDGVFLTVVSGLRVGLDAAGVRSTVPRSEAESELVAWLPKDAGKCKACSRA
jgi:hypothetical protein